jgi:Flp pilus assembly protein TadD
MSPLDYLLSQGWAIPHYLRLAAWPDGLVLDYGRQPVGPRGWPGVVLLALGLGCTLIAWRRAAKWGWLAFLASAFYLILAPSSSFVPIVTEIAAERRMYLPLAAVLMLTAIGVVALLRRWSAHPGRLAMILFAPAFVASATATFLRSKDYQSTEIMWRDAVEKRPQNARAHWNLGTELLVGSPPRVAAAEASFLKAVSLDSTEAGAWYNLGEITMARGDADSARTLYERALRFSPNHPKARDRYERLLASSAPSMASESMRLVTSARALLDAGKPDSAVKIARRGLDQPDATVQSVAVAASVFLRAGRASAAEMVLVQATSMEPRNAQLWSGLGSAQAAQGKWAAAERSFSQAIQINPDDANAKRGLRLVQQLRRGP